jgi:hypothetical protein
VGVSWLGGPATHARVSHDLYPVLTARHQPTLHSALRAPRETVGQLPRLTRSRRRDGQRQASQYLTQSPQSKMQETLNVGLSWLGGRAIHARVSHDL